MNKTEQPITAWRVVRPDFTSKNDYRWPFPGHIARPRETERKMTTGNPCPQFDGDGLCLAKTWAGAASGGIPAIVALECTYLPSDVLGEDANKVRVRKAYVVDVFSPERLIRDGWMVGADLYDADLRGANLRGADLHRTDLYGANLRGADLHRANLYGANLRGADLRDADLYDADLRGANLRGADLRGANLYDADLRGADLRGADLRGVMGVSDLQSRGASL